MTARLGATVTGVDAVGTAGGLGAIAGVASVGWPFFDGMTAALVALAAVGWVARMLPGIRADRRAPPSERRVVLLVLAALAVGWAYFLLASGAWVLGRGIVLGASGACIGWVGRQRPAFGEGTG